MIDKLKNEAMKRGMKLLSSPAVMRAMADPRLMKAISQGYAYKGKMQESIDSGIKAVASKLNLATKEDITDLKRSYRHVEGMVSEMQEKD